MAVYVWFVILAVLLMVYVLLDGYDLGVGILTLGEKDHHARHEMVEEVVEVWDGNETWLVLVGVGLWAGLPLAYGALLPHMYVPVFVMLFGLIVRGVSIEMISQRGGQLSEWWYRAFGIGSLVAAFAQGYAVGTLTVPVQFDENMNYLPDAQVSLGWYPWVFGVVLTVFYVAFGYAFMRSRSQIGQYGSSRRGATAVVVAAVLGAVALALLSLTAAPLRWDGARPLWFGLAVLVALGGAVMAYRSFATPVSVDHRPMGALWGTYALALGGVGAIMAGRLPELAPGMPVEAARAPDSTYTFLFVGMVVFIVLAGVMNVFAHRVLSRSSRNSVWTADQEVTYAPVER